MHYYGDFYRLRDLRCRSTLEIVAREWEEPNQLLERTPDCTLIMSNPGASRPLNGCDGTPRDPSRVYENPELTRTWPEEAQNAVVALMRSKGFSHMRVLNLSDVRAGSNFGEMVAGLPDGHSIFSEVRRPELRRRLRDQSIVVVGWSYEKELGQLGKTAYDTLALLSIAVHGWNPRFGFAYPHPTQGPNAEERRREWLRGIVDTWPEGL